MHARDCAWNAAEFARWLEDDLMGRTSTPRSRPPAGDGLRLIVSTGREPGKGTSGTHHSLGVFGSRLQTDIPANAQRLHDEVNARSSLQRQ